LPLAPDLALIHGAVCAELRQFADFLPFPPGETRLILAAPSSASPPYEHAGFTLAAPSSASPHYEHAGFTASQIARQELQTLEQKLEKGKGKEKAKD
jgi:hypothetical protein